MAVVAHRTASTAASINKGVANREHYAVDLPAAILRLNIAKIRNAFESLMKTQLDNLTG